MASRGQSQKPPPLHMRHSPYDMPPHLEQKLSAQHMQLQKFTSDNKMLIESVETLRRELAAKQNELKAVKMEKMKRKSTLLDKISKMEIDLKSAETFKSELEKSRAEKQSLVLEKKELISKAQNLKQDIQRADDKADVLPALILELEGLRDEYKHIRAAYDYERRICNGQLESLQVMEKNYVNMAIKVNNLQAELNNTDSAEKRPDASYNLDGSSLKGLANGQCSVGSKIELYSKIQEIQRPHSRVDILRLTPEFNGLRRDYEHIGATYHFEKNLYNGHLESNQVMGKNHVNMAREIEKFEAEVNKISSAKKRSDEPYRGTSYSEKDGSGEDHVGQKTTKDDHDVSKKPSRSARRTKVKRQKYKEIRKAEEEIFSAGMKMREDKQDGVAQTNRQRQREIRKASEEDLCAREKRTEDNHGVAQPTGSIRTRLRLEKRKRKRAIRKAENAERRREFSEQIIEIRKAENKCSNSTCSQ